MAGFSDDFLRFLQINFPDAFRRATADKVSDAVVNSITSRYAHRYEIWREIPEWIKSNHGDRIPAEVLNGNITVHDYVEKEKAKQIEKDKEINDAFSFSINLLALGYTTDTVTTLMENRELRDALLQESGGKKLSDSQFTKWLESREKDILAITDDWRGNQAEKMILRLAKELSRAKKREGRETSDANTTTNKDLIKDLESDLRTMAQKLGSRQSRQNMVDYLRAQPQQAALKHMDTDVRAMLIDLMKKQGIRIEPVKDSHTNTRISHNSLTESLKRDFANMTQSTNLVSDVIQRGKKNLERIVAKTKEKEKKKDIAKTVSLSKQANKRAHSA